MKYTTGSEWKTRDGKKAICLMVDEDDDLRVYHEDDNEVYYHNPDDGEYQEGDGSSPYDLIELWDGGTQEIITEDVFVIGGKMFAGVPLPAGVEVRATLQLTYDVNMEKATVRKKS